MRFSQLSTYASIQWILLPLLFSSCFKGKEADLIIHNAKIYSVDEQDNVFEAIAIKDGKIVELGPERQILNKYTADEEIDLGGKDIYPGFTDAHGHILSLAKQKLGLELRGALSFDEVLIRIEKYAQRSPRKFILARGWDQSLWSDNQMPVNDKLNLLFPTVPVLLLRVDGHAALANDALLKKAKISTETKIEGGAIGIKDGKCTGILMDNALYKAQEVLPPYSAKEMKKAILEIQGELFQYGITSVHEAGVENEEISLFENLISSHELDLNVYAMLLPSEKNIAFAKQKGIYQNKNLLIRSFKIIGDGALGSRGACLKETYSDNEHDHGMLTVKPELLRRMAIICETSGYQMNTHAIGDSTVKIILEQCKAINEVNRDHRWRIEHAQVIDPKDFDLFASYGVFPSVQPTHAVSDMRWAIDRLGAQRMKGAYAYATLLKKTGMIALGTDFPIENFNPFLTIHAAVQRKDRDNLPMAGFYPAEALTFSDCIKGMTIWPAFASFQERTSGNLEKGKDATFVVLQQPLISHSSFKNNFAQMTYIKGKKVYSAE